MQTANHKWLVTLATLAFSTLASSAALGQNWANPVSGSYGNPANWTPNGVPVNPTFDLNSSGYTVTLPSAESATILTVQTDNPTLDLNGQTLTLGPVFSPTGLEISTQAGEIGSLTVLGPGSIIANAYNAVVNVGGSGTGQLIVNGATIDFGGSNGTSLSEGSGSGITVENGGRLVNAENGATLNGSVVLNDGTLSSLADMSLGDGAMLSNHSTLSAVGNMTFDGNVTVDDSTVSSSAGLFTKFTGSLTVSGGGTVGTTGTLTLPVTTTDLSGDIFSDSDMYYSGPGTTTIQLSASTNDPFGGASEGHYAGILDFTLQNSFTPVIGENFNIFDYLGGDVGVFSAVNLPALPGGESWDISHLYSTGVISVVPEPASMTLLVAAAAGVLLRRRRGE
ncbi:MAG TPA: PEP-CTERM sorting domain-containing protein [Tepidisphaeraceae bacterium]|nr:PEP-CTERM sorting domain-containing protein [Tepidisphaeraceae bacterium]